MPPKAKIAAPIDRPLSKAYVREFTGWSTAEPPGISDPTSLRIMENVQINRDGSCRVRPGLRYLSYEVAPADGGGGAPPPDGGGSSQNGLRPHAYTDNAASVRANVALVGSEPLADQDDAGYVSGASGSWGCTFALDQLTGYTVGDPITLHIRIQVVLTDPAEWAGTGEVFLATDAPGQSEIASFSTTETSSYAFAIGAEAVNQIHEYVLPLNLAAWPSSTVESVVTALEAGAYLDLNAFTWQGGSEPPSYQIHEAWIEAAGSGPTDPGGETGGAGIAYDRPFVGTHEPFYLNDGTKAYLCGVREEDGTVGFRALKLDLNDSAMYTLDDPVIDFVIPQGAEVLNFTADTTYVTYLQIDNKVFALSDNGENMRVFSVGEFKEAKTLNSIESPDWTNEDKLTVVHPDAEWIAVGEPDGVRRNRVPNPSFQENKEFWNWGDMTQVRRPANPPITPVSGNRALRIGSKPERTNLATHPLHDVASTGTVGWNEGGGGDSVVADGDWLKLEMPAKKGQYQCRSRHFPGVDSRTDYRVALDIDHGAHVDLICQVKFFGINGAQVGETREFIPDISGSTRWVSGKVTSPKGAVTVRVYPGGINKQNDATNIRIKNVMFFKAGEGSAMFHGDSGANYFWTDGANKSSSVYHPPANISLSTTKIPVNPGKAHSASLHIEAGSTPREATLKLRILNKNSVELEEFASAATPDVVGAMTRLDVGSAGIHAKGTQAVLRLVLNAVPRGEYHWVDAAMLEPTVSEPGDYFDGSTPDVPTAHNRWQKRKKKHASVSIQELYLVGATPPAAEERTAETLIATGGKAVNVHQFGFFYTFENEVGESAASRIKVRRAQRAWADWLWETPDLATGNPSGTETSKPNLACDQLVAIMPEDVFDIAMAQGAIRWNLYMFSWSDQEPAPVTASLVGTRELPEDSIYDERGWIRVTPLMADTTEQAVLPTEENRFNYSDPSRAGQGLVASDRMILVNDPTDAAVIKWSSNKLGEYSNFTSSKGGGYKTLTSGNMFVPVAAKLWQNPQSADTICILCLGTDGNSVSYYMAPAQVASQSEALNVMGFEETTATPGTTSPYGVEIFNNSMYHPLDDQLMKSTASNYNINHKSQTDVIRNMWEKLANKYWIISAQHDNRLYYIVTNPEGDQVEDGCKGNEVWVFDAQAKNGTWSRFKIQALALRKIQFGDRVYMSVIRPDGVYYLDPEFGLDDVVDPDTKVVSQAAVPWKLESNTQGANKAHDAWCHLQHLSVSLGYFQGRMRYGLRSVDVNGKVVDMSKIVRDVAEPTLLAFDIEDTLSVRRDLKEWFFYAESIEDEAGLVEPSYGQINMVQFRYTPVSVNVGYEHGSIETFEYGRDVALAASSITDNGIPLPLTDSRRP